ncbi:hypothetical protein COHA_002813 [Chlorella ohadii]|uniref:Uncharacterized protein n=1 Tax=Chlorella ohadii TaxID=2649997 RepID=A0AAD5DWJ2_9CHLO|nr:hypothetical protein COHA_002813 [Chlorella ohadii]
MSRPMRAAARRAEAAGAWHELPEDLVCHLASLLPIRERFGVLPLLNHHYHAISLRWPIGSGMGVTQLFLPTERLSSEGIAHRSQRLQAWLGRHSQQLNGLRCDLPVDIHRSSRVWEPALEGRAASLRAVLPAMEATLWQHRTALASLLLSGTKLEAAVAAAAAEDGDSPLAGCTALESLTVLDYKGPAEVLAAAIAPLASLTRLELAQVEGTPRQLQRSRSAPPMPLRAVLKAIVIGYRCLLPLWYHPEDCHWQIAGLAACTGLTRLDVGGTGGDSDDPALVGSSLAHLRQGCGCCRVPGLA